MKSVLVGMRELALVTFRIVDENTRFQAEEVRGLFTPDYDNHYAWPNMERLDRPDYAESVPKQFVVSQTADGDTQFRPKAEMVIMRIEPCNLDSALGGIMMDSDAEYELVETYIEKLAKAGERLLEVDNKERLRLHDMSRALGGSGLEKTDQTQFYAVFDVSAAGDQVAAVLEGVLRLDKVAMAIDEAIML